MSDIDQFEIRDQPTIRDAILRVIRNGLIGLGVVDPNVTPNSDYYITATATANELAVVEANAVIKCDEQMPDTCTGTALDRWLVIVGLTRAEATGAVGNVVYYGTAPSPITLGQQLIDSAGLIFEVTTPGTYAPGASVSIRGVSTGLATNHLNGDVLTWVSSPAFASPPTVTVGIVGGTDGLIDGVDAEDDETARARLLSRLANPPAAGNWEHCAEVAEASSPVVEKAFPYPAIQGPSTVAIVVTGRSTAFLDITGPTATRQVDPTILSSQIAPYIRGVLPEYADIAVTTVIDTPTDVSIGLSLPAATSASPAGPGGGWIDGSPWPVTDPTFSPLHCDVTGVISTTIFQVQCAVPPSPGVSSIAYLDRVTWTLRTARVLTSVALGISGLGPFVITVDTPMLNIAVGDYVFPQSLNQEAYVNAILRAFAAMGPGEKTSNVTILQRGYRHPLPQQQWPSSLGAQQLRALSDVGSEVLDVAWIGRTVTTPPVPGAITTAPGVLVPQRLAFYPIR